MDCKTCGQPIAEARVRALAGAVEQCVDCAREDDVPKSVGYMVWDHKTAPYVEIDTITAVRESGRKHRYGPHFRLDSKEPKTALEEAFEPIRMDLQNREEHAHLEPTLSHPAHCHPDRPRIGPNGYCLECALKVQRKRLRHGHK